MTSRLTPGALVILATIRAAYWKASEVAVECTVAATLIDKLEF